MPHLSIITPASRGAKTLSQLLRDMRNQTLRNWEHILVYDGNPPDDVIDLIQKEGGSQTIFVNIEKDMGDMRIAPGTKPRNYGVKIATGTYVAFADDDDRYKDTWAENLLSGCSPTSISVVQMSCSENRMYKNGDPNRTVLIPEVGMPGFPICCHVGTPCFAVPRKWALESPWQHEPEHDYRFIARICEKYRPAVHFNGGMMVDVDGVVTRGVRDWVSKPPFWRP